MARQARKYSEINTYTIVLRGRTDIFCSPARKSMFIDSMLKHKDSANVYAYAITNTDAYIVVNVADGNISKYVKGVTVSFARKYNLRFSFGKVFYDRYLSEPLNNTDSVLVAIKNINMITQTPGVDTSNWVSSYNDYFSDVLIDTSFVTANLGSKFEEYHLENSGAQLVKAKKLDDQEVAEYIYRRYHIKAGEVCKLPKENLVSMVGEIMKVTKVSARQVARITMLPLRMLWNIAKKTKTMEKVKND